MAFFSQRSSSMLFHLDSELHDLDACDSSLRDEALRALLRAHRLGDHVVVISREVCKHLLAQADLSRAECAILERIGLEFTQKAELPRIATTYVRVSPRKTVAPDGRAISVDF